MFFFCRNVNEENYSLDSSLRISTVFNAYILQQKPESYF